MFRDYLIIDNFFDNPDQLFQVEKNLTYNSAETQMLPGVRSLPPSTYNWRGFRSNCLSQQSPQIFSDISNTIKTKIFSNYRNCSLDLNSEIFFHYSPGFIKYDESWWHCDECIFAGLVYLNYSPEKNSGTILKINGSNFCIENVFNRCLVYNSSILHRPEKCFGDSKYTSRFTTTFFIYKLSITNWFVHE